MGEFNICFNADNNYTEQLGVAITSILKNSDKEDRFNFYVLDGGFTKESKNQIQELSQIKDFKISYIKMNLDDFKNCPLLKDYNKDFKHFHVPMSAYFRFKMASVFPKLDKILYLDCDLIVASRLKELYESDLTDKYAAMVLDVENENEAERLNIPVYCNAGVMLINLAKWREDSIEEKLFEYAEKNKETILWQDQDVLNVVLKGKIKILPRKWNFQFFQYDPSRYEGLFEKYYEYNILHFAGKYKPWNNETIHPLFNEYYSYLQFTPWKKNLVNYKKQAFDKFFSSDIKGSVFYEDIMNTQRGTEKQVEEIQLKSSALFGEIIKANKYTDEKFQEIISYADEKITTNNTELYRYAEHIVGLKGSELNEEIGKVYKFVETKNAEIAFEEQNKTDQKIAEVFAAIEKVYKYAEEIVQSKNEEFLDNIKNVEGKIVSLEHNSRLEIHEQKEFLNRLIQTKTDNLRSFFEEAIKTQLDIVKKTYESLSNQQKSLYESELKNKITYLEDVMASRLENQKTWYENELNNQKHRFENEIQKQINDTNNWHTNNLNEKLSLKEEFYKNELIVKKDEYSSVLNDIQNKLNETQNSLFESQTQVSNLQNESSNLATQITDLKNQLKESQDKEWAVASEKAEKEREIEFLNSNIQAKEGEIDKQNSSIQEKDNEIDKLNSDVQEKDNEIEKLNTIIQSKNNEIDKLISDIQEKIQEQESQKLAGEKELNDLKEYYELKIKPVAKLINLVESKNKNLKK